MRISTLTSTSLALALAVAVFDASPAEAQSQGRFTRKIQRKPVIKRHLQLNRDAKPHFKAKAKKQKRLTVKKPLAGKKLIVKKPAKVLIGKGLVKKTPAAGLVRKRSRHLVFGKVGIKNLPIHKAAAGTAMLRGRLGLPRNVQPKLTLLKAPKPQFSLRFAPFLQRHWKKSFVWVAVAGLGYLTIPEVYYDQFLGYISEDDPDYDACIGLLSLAALEEEEEIVRVRTPMPANAVYRYTAKAEPVAAGGAESACTFDPFVERTWSRAFAWVQIPQVGNVTVPEDYYDRFLGFVSAQPADYPAACTVLVEAAAMDTVTMATPDRERQFQ